MGDLRCTAALQTPAGACVPLAGCRRWPAACCRAEGAHNAPVTTWRGWWLGCGIAAVLAGTALVRWDIAQRRDDFQAQARTAHRLLSQRAAELDAILATLALLAPEADAAARLPALHPQVLRVQRGAAADGPPLSFDAARRRFTLRRGQGKHALAIEVDIDRWRPADDWPFAADGPVAARLVLGDQAVVLNAGAPARGVTQGFVFGKRLGPPSLPFELQAQRQTGPTDWPWPALAALAAGAALVAAAGSALQRQRAARRRAEALLRLDRTARLNQLGEMAAGFAHELNQPLAAVLAGTQAARRMVEDEPLPPPALVEALDHAVAQTRRAADIVARLRRRVERPELAPDRQPLALRGALQHALALLAPELDAAGVQVALSGPELRVQADPVALDQILHNLLLNALQTLRDVPAAERRLDAEIAIDGAEGRFLLRDHGPGLAPEVLARLFQPFTSTRPGGLGLSLSETLALTMGGRLAAQNAVPHGAEFRLWLPLVP